MECNPSTSTGFITILDHTHKYVPIIDHKKEKEYTLLCHGDGLSIERHVETHRSRAASSTAAGQLKALEPVAGEFHKAMLLTQVVNIL